MRKLSFYVVNSITGYRLLAAPVLLFLILAGYTDVFKWALAVSFFTDAIDGFLARKLNVVSAFGSTLDSIGDDLTVGIAVVGMMFQWPGFIREEIHFVILLSALFIVQIASAVIRYGRISSFHTYLAKLAAVLQAIFLLVCYFKAPVYELFYVAVFITAVELIEEIILVIKLPTWEHNVKGLYWIIKRNKKISGNTDNTL